MAEVISTTANIPVELEPFRKALHVGLYKLCRGNRPAPCELEGPIKATRIEMTEAEKKQISELLEEGEYKTQTEVIRNALLIVKQGPSWLHVAAN